MSDPAAVAVAVLQPIAGANPAGAAVRYEPEFEQLAAEIEKLTSVEQTPVDWRRVIELGATLLGKGKDLLVAAYLAHGLFERHGYAGLARGCEVLQGMVERFWDGAFPELRRLRARIAAFEWLVGRLEKTLAGRGDAGTADRDGLEGAIKALEAVLDDPQRRFDGEPPNLSPAIRALRGKLATVPAPEPEPEPAQPPPPASSAGAAANAAARSGTASPAPEPPAAAAPPPAPREPESPAEVAEALTGLRERQLRFAAVLRSAEAADPRAFALEREALWSELPARPTGAPLRLEITVGEPQRLAAMRASLESGEFEQALAAANEAFRGAPLWLDLQQVVVEALDGLGRRHARAQLAVTAALAFLLRRAPWLVEAEDRRGTPLAAPATRVFLHNEVLDAAGGPASPEAGLAAEARRLLARNRLPDAMRLLTGRIDATASRRGRFVLRLDLASLCIEAGRLELAVPQLEQLEQEVSHFSLEEWEPDLATAVVRALWQCCAGPKPPPSLADRSQDIYARLCRLDPAAAVAATGPRGG